jgi:hypothetical protein
MLAPDPSSSLLAIKETQGETKKKHTTIEISTNNQTYGDMDGLEGKTKGKGKKKSKQTLSSKQTSDK